MPTTHTTRHEERREQRDLILSLEENRTRLRELADTAAAENRELTEAERVEAEGLRREIELQRMRVAAGPAAVPAAASINREQYLRECMAERRPATFMLSRELMTSAGVEDTGIIRIDEQEMLKPLRAGLIYDKLGINVRSGNSGNKLRWARHGNAIAQFASEGERLTDAKVDFDALSVKPERLGVAIPVTREELESSEGIVENVIREEMPAAVVDTVNDALLNTTGTYTNTEGAEKPRKVHGPFVDCDRVQFAGAVPTRKELLKLKAKVTATGIQLTAPCFVMTETMKAELEEVKVDAGSGRFLCENDHVLGIPVFTSPAIGEGNIGFGDWSYQAAGFFGAMAVTVDPYTLARQNATDFVLNTHFATATLYKEAFVLGVAKGA